MRRVRISSLLVLTVVASLATFAAQTNPSSGPALAAAAAARRAALMQRLLDGIAIIQSVDRGQPNIYEFFVPSTEHHDFLYLTGLDRSVPPGSVLMLNPRGQTYREVLYTSDDVEQVRKATGIAHVFPYTRFLEDLSSALTDYRNLRITQLRFKPVASDISRGWGESRKVIYFNYPRFTNLNEPSNPRMDVVQRLREASPEVEMRDSADLLDRMRMIQDEYSLTQLRRAIEITGKGLGEVMKIVRPGMTTREAVETLDYVYRLNGATLGFHTGVASGPQGLPIYATARAEMEEREGSRVIRAGDLVWFDTGAAYNFHSADIQRQVPADKTFTPEQRKLYEIVLNVQKSVIASIKPGVRWQDLHDMAVRMLAEAGGLDQSYTYGIGHFIGMDVHDHGNYGEPLQPGMVMAIEQGAILNGLRVAFEDDVLVTATGHEWLTKFIPHEVADIERLRQQPAYFDPLGLLVRPR